VGFCEREIWRAAVSPPSSMVVFVPGEGTGHDMTASWPRRWCKQGQKLHFGETSDNFLEKVLFGNLPQQAPGASRRATASHPSANGGVVEVLQGADFGAVWQEAQKGVEVTSYGQNLEKPKA